MKKKYYTPTIEEFHVGFEYEIKDLDGSKTTLTGNPNKDKPVFKKHYSKAIYEITDWFRVWRGLDHDNIRVKPLDKEDIESFGFHTEDNGECYNKSIGWMIISIYPWNDVGGEEHEYKITVDSNTNFHGIIKNKSELKRLLKQLNIE